jgi:hypothetical protein
MFLVIFTPDQKVINLAAFGMTIIAFVHLIQLTINYNIILLQIRNGELIKFKLSTIIIIV